MILILSLQLLLLQLLFQAFSPVSSSSSSSSSTSSSFPSCLRTLPHPGAFSPHPPYFFPRFCPTTRRFDEAATVKCLANRTVYVMGNSIGRQFMFNILELLGGVTVLREGQKKMCPKHETKWDASCLEYFKGVKLKFLFFRYIDGFDYKDRGGFPFIKDHHYNESYESLPNSVDMVLPKTNHEKNDNCVAYMAAHPGSTVTDCLNSFWKGATSDDILITQLGFAFCEQENPDHVDYMAWLRASASAFRSIVMQHFPGTIFRTTNAPVLKEFTLYNNVPNCMKEVDKHLFELWHPSTFTNSERWFNIDQYNINEGHLNLYNDGVHFMGPLSEATVQLVLNAMCPLEGASVVRAGSEHVALNGTMVFLKKLPSSTVPSRAYYIDQSGYFRLIRNATGACTRNIIHTGEITMTEDEFDNRKNPIGKDFPTYCEANTLINVGFGKSIYVALESGLCQFQSMTAMSSRGFDLDQGVARIHLDDFKLFKLGEDLV